MRKLFLVLILLASSITFAQKNVKVNTFFKGYEPEEPSIYINPLNPDNIIAGANIDNFYYSFDGGKTWGEGKLPGPIVWGDPVLHFDYLGNAYFTHLGTFPIQAYTFPGLPMAAEPGAIAAGFTVPGEASLSRIRNG